MRDVHMGSTSMITFKEQEENPSWTIAREKGNMPVQTENKLSESI